MYISIFLSISVPCVKEEGGPGAVELVWDVPLPERDQPTHVIHARDLDKKMDYGFSDLNRQH